MQHAPLGLSFTNEFLGWAQYALSVKDILFYQIIPFFHRDRIGCINKIMPVLTAYSTCHPDYSIGLKRQATIKNRQGGFSPKKVWTILGITSLR